MGAGTFGQGGEDTGSSVRSLLKGRASQPGLGEPEVGWEAADHVDSAPVNEAPQDPWWDDPAPVSEPSDEGEPDIQVSHDPWWDEPVPSKQANDEKPAFDAVEAAPLPEVEDSVPAVQDQDGEAEAEDEGIGIAVSDDHQPADIWAVLSSSEGDPDAQSEEVVPEASTEEFLPSDDLDVGSHDAEGDDLPLGILVGSDYDLDGLPSESDDPLAWGDDGAFGRSETGFGIYDYDAEARQPIWTPEEDEDELIPRRAREKAAAVASLVDVQTRREQNAVLAFLTDLFQHLQHPSTFRALRGAAEQGMTADVLYAAVALKVAWTERPDWWKGRYGYGGQVGPLRNGATAFSWALAIRVCRKRLDYAPEMMIDEDWFQEWLDLAAGSPGYLSFPSYIDAKLASLDDELFADAVRALHRIRDFEETAERTYWYRIYPEFADMLNERVDAWKPDIRGQIAGRPRWWGLPTAEFNECATTEARAERVKRAYAAEREARDGRRRKHLFAPHLDKLPPAEDPQPTVKFEVQALEPIDSDVVEPEEVDGE